MNPSVSVLKDFVVAREEEEEVLSEFGGHFSALSAVKNSQEGAKQTSVNPSVSVLKDFDVAREEEEEVLSELGELFSAFSAVKI